MLRVTSPALPKSAPIKKGNRRPRRAAVRRTLKRVESVRVDEEDLIKTVEEESEESSTTGTTEDEAVTENLRSVCPSCHKRFANNHLMGRHFTKMHKNHYRCKGCEYIYESKDILEEHSQFHKKKSTPLDCPSCHKKYKHQGGLRRHQIRAHSMVEPKAIRNKNDDAPASDDESQKTNRLRMKSYTCRNCDNVYLEYSHLVAHERLTHGIRKKEPKKFKCNVCKRNFRSEFNLRRHSGFHEKSFYCDDCGGEFTSKQSIRMHMRKHTGEKPYKCKLCSRTYAQVGVLRVHMLTHTGERPYVCNICGKRFTQRSSMMYHHRKHPGNHPPPPRVSLTGLETNVD
ncbi:zinc finger protein 1 homolog [Hylaeus anthracinus]|uniref:zinc finger protein 1 homolog n=1 Tax=Hylaeus anthracinus TaxID=313031 RepID=UPI0023B902AB|nr:zinc finger protein 1 homolog [Hylaeus anthracinus]